MTLARLDEEANQLPLESHGGRHHYVGSFWRIEMSCSPTDRRASRAMPWNVREQLLDVTTALVAAGRLAGSGWCRRIPISPYRNCRYLEPKTPPMLRPLLL